MPYLLLPSPAVPVDYVSARAVFLNLEVMTPLGSPEAIGKHSYEVEMKIVLWLRVTTWGTILEGCCIRKVESHWSRGPRICANIAWSRGMPRQPRLEMWSHPYSPVVCTFSVFKVYTAVRCAYLCPYAALMLVNKSYEEVLVFTVILYFSWSLYCHSM